MLSFVSATFQLPSLPGSLANMMEVAGLGSTGVVSMRIRTVRGVTKSILNFKLGSFS